MKKKLFLILNLIVMAILVKAQAPNAIPYQGVARNAAGNILPSQPISLRVSIHDVTAAGTVVFSETHSATTTTLGLFNVNIGTGTAVTGTLAGVNWGSGAKFIQVEFDPAGGSNYTDMGTTQLNSVPYALYAGNASSSGQWTTSGNDIYNSNSGNVGIGTSTATSKLTIVKPLGNSLELLSGSNDDWTSMAIGRAAEEMNFGVATAPNNFMNGTEAGDAVIRVNDNTKKIVISPWVDNPTMVVTGTSVGISNTSPSYKLDVGAESGVSARMKGNLILDGSDGTFGTGWIGLRNNTSALEWDVEGSADYFTIGRSNVGYDVTIANNGNVGIGTGNTNAPAAKLEVAGNVKITDGTQGAGKVLTSDATGVASWQDLSIPAETDPGVSNSITNQVAKWDGSTLVDGLITDDGTNVGIGTSTPTSKLTIVKPLGNSLELLSGSNSDWTSMAIGRAAEEMNFGVATAPNNFMNGTEAGDAVIRVNDNTKKIVISPWVDNPTMVVTGTSVGISNTSPSYKLDVGAESGVSARMKGNLILDGSDGTFGTGWIGFRNNTSALEWDVEGSADYFTIGRSNVGYDVTIANNGNVGIGTGNTNAPAAKLEVAGNVKITDGTQGAGKVLISDANGVASWSNTAPLLKTVNTDLNPSGFAITNAQNNQLIYDDHSWTIPTDLVAGFTCDAIYFSNFSGTITCSSAILYEKNSNTAVSSINMPAGAHVRIQAVNATHVFVTVY